MSQGIHFLPAQASEGAAEVDMLSLAILLVAGIFSLGIAAAILFFSLRYWHGRDVDRQLHSSRLGHWAVELTWSGGPLMILIGLFIWGAKAYFHAQQPPADALHVSVVAKQWMWKIGHEHGRREINTLHVPTGRNVRLTMISEDVIHSFYVPGFRRKQDVLPGRFTTLWFRPSLPGTYHLFCAEYCGTSHSKMIGRVIVQTPNEYAQWLAAAEQQTPQQAGLRWLHAFGCLQCHSGPSSAAGGDDVGPSLTGLYGRRVPLADGRTIVADENYLLRSILQPGAAVVAGFPNRMPSFDGEIQPEQLLEIIAYLRSVADATGPVAGPGEPSEIPLSPLR